MFCFPIKFCSCVDSVVCFVFLLNFVDVLTVLCFVFLLNFVAVFGQLCVACFVFLLNFVAVLTVWHVLFSY